MPSAIAINQLQVSEGIRMAINPDFDSMLGIIDLGVNAEVAVAVIKQSIKSEVYPRHPNQVGCKAIGLHKLKKISRVVQESEVVYKNVFHRNTDTVLRCPQFTGSWSKLYPIRN